MEIIKSNPQTDTTEFFLLLAQLTKIDVTLEVEKLKQDATSLIHNRYGDLDLTWNELLRNSMIFNYGYVQGVRNERAKRKTK